MGTGSEAKVALPGGSPTVRGPRRARTRGAGRVATDLMTDLDGRGHDPAGSAGDDDLAERQALRRVAGLSTELADVTEVEYRRLRLERVVLVGVWTTGTLSEAANSLAAAARLREAQ